MTLKQPGRKSPRRPVSRTTSAARRLISARSQRLWYIRGQNSQGTVKVMCCHSPSGTRPRRYCIQTSPAFTPQCGQERLLQRKQTFLSDRIRGQALPAGVSHERGAAGHDFCDGLHDSGTDRAFRLFVIPVKPAVALLKDIGEAGKHNHFTEGVGVGVITVAEGHDKSQPSGCLLGKTTFIVDNFVNSLGLTFTNFVHMSLFTDPIDQGSFNKDWTVFYWLYWITYTLGISIFITRVSRGRTVRELILGLILGGCAGCWFFFGSMSGFAIDLFNSSVVNAPALLQANAGESAVSEILSQLPFGSFFSLFYFLLMLVFLASHLDATAYTVAAVSTKGLQQGQDPKRELRVFWCIMLGLIPLAMLYINASLSTLKTAVTLTAAPFIVILIICAYGLIKWIKNHNFEKGVK